MSASSRTSPCSPACARSSICPRSIFACKRLIREFQPNVVFGVGGYASGPAMAAALWLKIPAMAFEPNAMPGLANRLVGKRVQAAAVNFPSAAKLVPQRRGHRHSRPPGVLHACSAARQRRAASASLRRLAGRAHLQCASAQNHRCSAARSPRTHRSPSERRAPLRADPGRLCRQRRRPKAAGRSGPSSTTCPPALPRPRW